MPTVFKLIAAVLALLGIILILLSAYYGLDALPPDSAQATTAGMTSLKTSFLLLLQAVGVAFVGFAIFGILVDTKQWREYFSSRLREIVIEHEYLHSLTTEKLQDLQGKFWQVLYRNPNIGQQGTFLSFCSEALHKFINAPYRENLSVVIHMKPCGDPGLLEVTDCVTHVCRSAGGRIQSAVGFCVDAGEMQQLRSLRVVVRHPKIRESEIGERELFREDDLSGEDPGAYSKKWPLADDLNLDGLVVAVESTYTIHENVMQTWSNIYPTRDFDLLITCPPEFDVQFRPFVLRPEVAEISVKEGYGRIRYSSWMVPESGVAWQLQRRGGSRVNDVTPSE